MAQKTDVATQTAGLSGQIMAKDGTFTRFKACEARKQPQQARLPGSIGSEDHEYRAVVEFEIDAGEDWKSACQGDGRTE
jgi:hypothetical protein